MHIAKIIIVIKVFHDGKETYIHPIVIELNTDMGVYFS